MTPAQTLEMQGLTVVIDQKPVQPDLFRREECRHPDHSAWRPDCDRWGGPARSHPGAMGPGPGICRPHARQRAEPGRRANRRTRPPISPTRSKSPPRVTAFAIAVDLDQPLPQSLAGKAGFNLDFLPTTYFGKTYLMDRAPGLFPRHPDGPMAKDGSGDPLPIAEGGHALTLAPEDPLTRVTITSDGAPTDVVRRPQPCPERLVCRSFDDRGRRQGQCDRVARAAQCHKELGAPAGRIVQPVRLYPDPQQDRDDRTRPQFFCAARGATCQTGGRWHAPDGVERRHKPQGRWTRYNYASFDFSSVRDPGIYAISYAGSTTNPFRISADAYGRIWQASLDTFIAEQMDHIGRARNSTASGQPLPTSTMRGRHRRISCISMPTRWAQTSIRHSSRASISPA